jgi:hypothetical protein
MVILFVVGIKKEKTLPLTLAVILTFAILVSFEQGFYNPVYKAMADPNFSLSWIFRDPFKISLAALGVFLFAFSIVMAKLSERAQWFGIKLTHITRCSIVIPVVILIILWSPAQKTLDILNPTAIPDRYVNAASYLNGNYEGPTIFVPDSGSEYTWAENKNLETQLLATTYTGQSYGSTITQNPYGRQLIDYALKTGDLNTLQLVAQGIVMDDSLVSAEYGNRGREQLGNDAYQFGEQLYLVRHDNFTAARISEGSPIYLVNQLDYSKLSEMPTNTTPFVFYDPQRAAIMNSGGALLVDLNPSGGDPSKSWAKGYSHDPLHGDWHHYLDKYEIENWQSDYDAGIAFTWAPKAINSQTTVSDELLLSWQFDSYDDILEWKGATQEKQAGALQILDWENRGLKTLLWNSTAGWKVIRSPPMEVDPSHYYRFALDIKGENTLHVHTKLVEYDVQNEVIASKNLNVLGDGTFPWRSATYDYSPTSDSVARVQLQIWHGDANNRPLPNIIWIDNVALYDLTDQYAFSALETQLSLTASDDYRVFVRYLKSPAGGQLGLIIDDKPFTLDSHDELNTFAWQELPSMNLKAGDHKIVLENIEGLNAVNLIAVIPKAQYDQALEGLDQQLDGKTLLTLFQADRDLYYYNANIATVIEPHKTLRYDNNGRSWQELEVIRDGTYVLAVKGSGEFQANIDGRSLQFQPVGGFAYSPKMSFAKGNYFLEVQGNQDSNLESIWFYSAEKVDALDEILVPRGSDSTILSMQKINPVRWELSISSDQPFVLGVAQYYDRMWEARIYRGDELVETAQPIQLYGMLTGFNINTTGEDIRVILQYKVQEGFNLAMSVSIIGFVAVIFYLFLDWRKEKISGRKRLASEHLVREGLTIVEPEVKKS